MKGGGKEFLGGTVVDCNGKLLSFDFRLSTKCEVMLGDAAQLGVLLYVVGAGKVFGQEISINPVASGEVKTCTI